MQERHRKVLKNSSRLHILHHVGRDIRSVPDLPRRAAPLVRSAQCQPLRIINPMNTSNSLSKVTLSRGKLEHLLHLSRRATNSVYSIMTTDSTSSNNSSLETLREILTKLNFGLSEISASQGQQGQRSMELQRHSLMESRCWIDGSIELTTVSRLTMESQLFGGPESFVFSTPLPSSVTQPLIIANHLPLKDEMESMTYEQFTRMRKMLSRMSSPFSPANTSEPTS